MTKPINASSSVTRSGRPASRCAVPSATQVRRLPDDAGGLAVQDDLVANRSRRTAASRRRITTRNRDLAQVHDQCCVGAVCERYDLCFAETVAAFTRGRGR